MDNRPQNHPGSELAGADERPAAGHAIAALDDMRLTGGARAVGGDDVAIVVNGVRRLKRKLRRRPVGIAVPDAPRDRGIGHRQFLEHRETLHRGQVEPAVSGRQEDAKKAGAGQFAREIFGEPAGRLDRVALRDDPLAELSRARKKIGALCRIAHRSLRQVLALPGSSPFPEDRG